jgi:hypothetical protein
MMAAPLGDRHAYSVALNEPATLVDNRVSRGFRVEVAMYFAYEPFEIFPKSLAISEVPKPVTLEEFSCQIGHLQQESQIAPLGRGASAVSLKNFEHADRLLLDTQRGQYEQMGSRISRLFIGGT